MIGRRCNRGNTFSRPVLIGRGLGFTIARACSGVLGGLPASAGASLTTDFPVAIATGSHPFPSRTRKLSLSAPMVLGGRPPGRVGRRRISLLSAPGHPGALVVFGPTHAGGRSIDGHVLGSTLSSSAPRGRICRQPSAQARRQNEMKAPSGAFIVRNPAASYSPRGSTPKYHRRWRA